ncbi:MAG: hypothetical protein LBQ15_01845 [Clostridium sp.]|nr:hypothetical protein [Clostridium sp.]
MALTEAGMILGVPSVERLSKKRDMETLRRRPAADGFLPTGARRQYTCGQILTNRFLAFT